MDDSLSEKLSQLLNSPEGMQKIQSTLAALGMGDGAEEETRAASGPAAAPSMGELASALSLSGETGKGGSPELQMMARLAPLLSGMKGEDDNTRLLKSLRPFLSGDREERLDESIKIMRLMKILPLLREQDLF